MSKDRIASCSEPVIDGQHPPFKPSATFEGNSAVPDTVESLATTPHRKLPLRLLLHLHQLHRPRRSCHLPLQPPQKSAWDFCNCCNGMLPIPNIACALAVAAGVGAEQITGLPALATTALANLRFEAVALGADPLGHEADHGDLASVHAPAALVDIPAAT